MNMVIAIQEPGDGFEQYERIFLREMVINMYKKIADPRDKFIIMAYFEMGYTEAEIGKIFEVSQVYIAQKIKEIRKEMKEYKEELGV